MSSIMKIIFLSTIVFLLPSVAYCMETQSETPPIYFVHYTIRPREGASTDDKQSTHVFTFKKVDAPDHITEAALEIITLKKDSTSANILLNLADKAKTFNQNPVLPYSQLQPILTTEPFRAIAENKESNALIVYLDSIYDIMGATTGQQIIDWSSPRSQESGCIEFNQETKSKAIDLLTTTLNMSETQPDTKKTNKEHIEQNIYFVQLNRIPRKRGTITNEPATHTMIGVSAPATIKTADLPIKKFKKDKKSTDIIIKFENNLTKTRARIHYSSQTPLLSTNPFNKITDNKEDTALIVYLNSNNEILGAITGKQIVNWNNPKSQAFGYVLFHEYDKNTVTTLLTTKLRTSKTLPDRPVQQLTPEQEQQKRYPLILRIICALGLGMLIGYIIFFKVLDSLLYQK